MERKNRSLQEMAKTLLIESKIFSQFWADIVFTACYIINRAFLRPILEKISYEFYKGRKPNISYFRMFGCECLFLKIPMTALVNLMRKQMMDFPLDILLQVKHTASSIRILRLWKKQ